MNNKIQQLYRKLNNQTVFIVGGGKSFKAEYIPLLQDKITVCINDAFKHFPSTAAIYWVDETWASTNYDQLMQHPCELRFTCRFTHQLPPGNLPTGLANSTVLRRTGDSGFDPDIESIRGNNSGSQVLNLVANMKPETIVLLGYDMNRGHWHNYERPAVTDTIYSDLFLPSVESMVKDIYKIGPSIRLLNASPNSAIRNIKKIDLPTFLKAKYSNESGE